ncbi:lysophospholipid acyltransferase family protein [Arenicella sp. 4NH20-0111]|uniref:lysophospholipid acyltransferase family protein n=1 Tax=Arenicella sp. 4NH20-0111 TaxID=3127648 RepID=UPI0031049A12
MPNKNNYFIGFIRIVLIVLWIVTMPLIYMVARLVRVPKYTQLPHVFHAGVCKILGIQVSCSGSMSERRPTLYLSNHVSYVDIFVLGQLPAYFIAKAEVASWPVLGTLAQFQNTLFIERKAGRAKQQLKVLQNHLEQSNSLTLFPEGTSTNGTHVEPFKSTLLESANLPDGPRVAIQPVTVAYTHYDGELIVDQQTRDHYAWYARMPFLPHFLGLMPRKKVSAKIHFHPVCYLDEFETRKECAQHCQKLVADRLDALVRGE